MGNLIFICKCLKWVIILPKSQRTAGLKNRPKGKKRIYVDDQGRLYPAFSEAAGAALCFHLDSNRPNFPEIDDCMHHAPFLPLPTTSLAKDSFLREWLAQRYRLYDDDDQYYVCNHQMIHFEGIIITLTHVIPLNIQMQ